MNFDEYDIASLPNNREEAFTEFVKKITDNYAQRVNSDRSLYSDQNNEYNGSYEPERSFATAVLAFLDEYGIESDIVDITELSNQAFASNFGKFKSRVDYMTTRFMLRRQRIESGTVGTLITIASSYKDEICKLLDTVRKIVNQEVSDASKKDAIMSRLAGLQSEVNREQTTVDALFGRMIDLSKAIGQSAENLGPLLDKLEQIKKLFWDNSKKVEQLPKPDRPKLITKEEDQNQVGSKDDIPF